MPANDELEWGTAVEIENRRRLRLALAAYAYEVMNISLMPDEEFDFECSKVDLSVDTGPYDEWWRKNFSPFTGMWVHSHPDKEGLEQKILRYYKGGK